MKIQTVKFGWKGEAFFHVKKTADHRRFVVHANHFDIIVTGTQFNVVNRDDKTNVMLTEGSVTIKKDDGEEIKMKPGDFVELDNNRFIKKEEKKENVLAWKEQVGFISIILLWQMLQTLSGSNMEYR